VKKGYKHTIGGGSALWLAAALIVLVGTGQCLAGQHLALMLQQSPVDGGTIEPGNGVHRIEQNTHMNLRAVPQPGYQFVTWLGDVAEPTANVTTTYMDSPKIVIAVFERIAYDSLAAADMLFSNPGGGAMRVPADFYTGSGGGGGGRRPHKYYRPRIPDFEPPDDDIVVPGDGTDNSIPVPGQEVPEPSTILLFGLGGLASMRRRRIRG